MIIANCICCGSTVKCQPVTKGFYCLNHGLEMDDERYKSGFEVTNESGKTFWVDDITFLECFDCVELEESSDSAKPNN